MLTSIDEAIAQELTIARNKRKNFDECNERKNNYACRLCVETQTCLEVAEEHEQIAEWLEELKDYRDKNKMVVRVDVENMDSVKDKIDKLSKYAESQYNKAIDDFIEKVELKYLGVNPDELYEKYYPSEICKQIKELAKQLKAGDNDGT